MKTLKDVNRLIESLAYSKGISTVFEDFLDMFIRQFSTDNWDKQNKIW